MQTSHFGKLICDCPVISISEVARGIFLMVLHAREIAARVQPGQFINVKTNDDVGLSPMLRRPFSVCQRDSQQGTISILWQVMGFGTRRLAAMKVDDVLNVIGPLGCGYRLPAPGEQAALVAGGLGVAPLPILATALQQQAIPFVAMLGARSRHELWGERELRERGGSVQLSTDDGSAGARGFVTEVLVNWLQSQSLEVRAKTHVYACGPMPMLKKLADVCHEFGVAAQVAIETLMGCGFGVCMGCPVEPAAGLEAAGGYYLACMDGPVFDADAIRYESIMD